MKLTKSTIMSLACYGLIPLFTGCASIMCGSQQKVALDSSPSSAEVLIYDARGDIVFRKTTPCTAKLDRRDPDYVQGARYIVLLKKEGYMPVQFPLEGVVNRAYAANVLSAGIGYGVDPVTGAMWTLTSEPMDPMVVKQKAGFFSQEGLLVTLREETTPDATPAPAPALKTTQN